MDAYYPAVFNILPAGLPRDDTRCAKMDAQQFYQDSLLSFIETEENK